MYVCMHVCMHVCVDGKTTHNDEGQLCIFTLVSVAMGWICAPRCDFDNSLFQCRIAEQSDRYPSANLACSFITSNCPGKKTRNQCTNNQFDLIWRCTVRNNPRWYPQQQSGWKMQKQLQPWQGARLDFEATQCVYVCMPREEDGEVHLKCTVEAAVK